MNIINRLFLLNDENQRIRELIERPTDNKIKYEEVRIEIHINSAGNTTEIETHSAIRFGQSFEQPAPIEISISSVTGALMSSSDFTHITCSELTNIIVKGNVAVNDRTFSMPIRRDDGRLILFPVTVVNGEFEAVLNFPTSGQYSYSDIEANIDLPPNTFTVAPIKLDVLRQTI
ncbi:hypothetical protein [Shewanella sp. SM74]|nr:hypothetical protein [Shewanella sp. SM74]MCU8012490.1 hypothetical protein [Shewanella sp. SM74]